MPIIISCECGKKMRLKDELRGKKFRCPDCKTILLAEDSASEDAPAGPKAAPPPLPPKTPAALPAPPPIPSDEPGDGAQIWTQKEKNSVTVFAVVEDVVCSGSFPRDEWKELRTQIDDPRVCEQVFGDKKFIPFDTITQVRIDLKRLYVAVDYKNVKDESETFQFNVKDEDEREDIFEGLRSALGGGWKRTEAEYSPMRAALFPGLVMVITVAVTVVMYLAAKQAETGDVEISGRRSGLKRIMVWLMETIGPTGFLIIGAVVFACCVGWLIMMMMNPPHFVRLDPKKRS